MVKDKRISYGVHGEVIYEYEINSPCNDELFMEIYTELVKMNYMLVQTSVNGKYVIRVMKFSSSKDTFKRVILFIATFVTIWLTGLHLTQGYYHVLSKVYGVDVNDAIIWFWATIYTVLFLLVLGAHEYGHMITSRKYNVPISGPYFIPAPPAQLGFIGTLGSVISMKCLPPTRKSLLLIGLAGPVFGFLTGLIVTVYGIMLSTPMHVSTATRLVEEGEVTTIPFMPLVMALLIGLRGLGPDYTLLLHPMAFVGFIIFIVTFLNLMPVGQLDGGHVVRAFTSPRTHDLIGYVVIILLMVIGLATLGTGGQIYLSIGIVLSIFKIILGLRPHPGSANMLSKIDRGSVVYIIIYIILIILTAPVPTA